MSAPQHTPGPWVMDEQLYKSASFYIRGSDENGLPLTYGRGAVAHIPRSTVIPTEANARLIAAAPDLLSVLQELKESAAYWSEYDVPLGIVDRINQAVAKATGEQIETAEQAAKTGD